MTSSVVRATVSHRRRRPFDYSFEHRTTMWLVDAADQNAAFPRWLRPWLRIRGRDHLGAGESDLHGKVAGWLRSNGVTWSAAQVRVLVNARTAGYVFDPITTYFCFDGEGRLEGILAEVHNTYGGSHVYPLAASPGREGLAASATKELYVSPFFTVDGRYDIRARLTDASVVVAITLTQGGERVFAGSVRGSLQPATRRAVLLAALRDPFASQRVAALIRWHGIRLWLRRLPVVPRPSAAPPGPHDPHDPPLSPSTPTDRAQLTSKGTR